MQSRILSGTVQSGGTSGTTPLANAQVTAYQTGDRGLVVMGRAATDKAGKFSITLPATGDNGIFYATADLGFGVLLATCIGPEVIDPVCINELTTVAAAYSLAQFIRNDVAAGSSFALCIGAGMNANVVEPQTGQSSPVLLSPPNADQTISLRVTRALANLLAACVRNPSQAPQLLYALATPPAAVPAPPQTSLQALANIACYPWQNVSQIYDNTLIAQAYLPALSAAPDGWTVAVKVNDSGGVNVPFGGPANIAFDRRGHAWVTNNVVQGTGVSSGGIIVLRPDGKPADGSDGAPRSPITGGGLLGTGFGVAIDAQERVWVGNFGWGNFNPAPLGMGSLSCFAADGQPMSPAAGYQGGAVRAQGVAVDGAGNVWIASFGNDSVVVYLGGEPHRSVSYPQTPGSGPFDVAIAADGSAWVTNSGGLSGAQASSVCKYVLSADGQLSQQFNVPLGKALKGLALDSAGNAWVASGGDDTVYQLAPDGSLLGCYCGPGWGGIDGPWGIAIDGNDNAWVANFGPLARGSQFTTSAVSMLAGANPDTRPYGMAMGAPVLPQTGYTLPTAGEQVLLPTGEPLYGPGRPPCYSPLMRLTSCVIDQAGNVWALNNWKPDFDLDMVNPGGDGIVIFLGLAKPPVLG